MSRAEMTHLVLMWYSMTPQRRLVVAALVAANRSH